MAEKCKGERENKIINLVLNFINVSRDGRHKLFPADSQRLQQKYTPNDHTNRLVTQHNTKSKKYRVNIKSNPLRLLLIFQQRVQIFARKFTRLLNN